MKRMIWTVLCILVLFVSIFAVSAAAETDCTVLDQYCESLTFFDDTCLDLNGWSVGTVKVEEGCTLQVKDSSTDDFEGTYGSIGSVTGNGSVVGMDGYMMIGETEDVSFHKVNLTITKVTLRSKVAGLYYTCNFEGDEAVASKVKSYGVALSVKAEPDAETIGDCLCSTFTAFNGGAGKNSVDDTSTVLTGIMKTTNGYMTNASNSQMEVWGRAYIKTTEGEYILGNSVSYTLREAVEEIDESLWVSLEKTQVEDVLSLYRRYTSVMNSWDVDKIKATSTVNTEEALYDPAAGDDLKLLAITSSFGRNTTDLLYSIAAAEAEAAGIDNTITVARLYGSGCSLQKHVNSHNSGTAIYEYSRISNETENTSKYFETTTPGTWSRTSDNTVTLVQGLQDAEWDIIFIQQGAAQAGRYSEYGTYITQLIDIIRQYQPNAKIVWNMTWAYEEDCTAFPSDYKVNNQADQLNMYAYILNATKLYVRSRNDIDAIIPSGTTIQNARAFYENYELVHTDLYHLSNLGKAFAGYTLYSVLTDQELTQINLATASSYDRSGTYTLTDTDKQTIIDVVNTSMRTPYSVTYTASESE